jgi:prophage regulatory protein
MSVNKHAGPAQTTKPRSRPIQPLDPAKMADALLRIRIVEALTGLGRSKIYAMLARDEFPQPVRLSARCTRFRAGDVQAWLAAQSR